MSLKGLSIIFFSTRLFLELTAHEPVSWHLAFKIQFRVRMFFEIFRQTLIVIISAESLTPRIIYNGESQLAEIIYSADVASLAQS
jgi:hypothetical protein